MTTTAHSPTLTITPRQHAGDQPVRETLPQATRPLKIATVHNAYGKRSGEETVVHNTDRLLTERGHTTCRFERSSAEIERMPFGRVRSFASGVYSTKSKRDFAAFLQREKPDLVHIHNLYPLISPSILTVARQANLPVVMTVHNYRLVCPNGLHLVNGSVCEKCTGGREYHCVLNNCEGSLAKSIGYAARTAFARKAGLYCNNVTLYATLTGFAKQRLADAGFDPDRIHVIPNTHPPELSPTSDGIDS
ncbi:MAG: glycosyltransferase, partial [Planctomycetota bacterium]